MRMRHANTIQRPRPRRLRCTQQGAALLIALIFVVVLTLLGLSVVGTTGIEERMARNFRDSDLAFQAAEAALRDAEIRIAGYYRFPAVPLNLLDFDGACTNGLCDKTAAACPAGDASCIPGVHDRVDRRFDITDSTKSIELGTLPDAGAAQTPQVAGVSDQPRYMVEALPTEFAGESASGPPKILYRITAAGFGRGDTTRVLLQETFIP